jgi:hypothetical protein
LAKVGRGQFFFSGLLKITAKKVGRAIWGGKEHKSEWQVGGMGSILSHFWEPIKKPWI